MVAYIVTSAFYNITEAGFRELDIVWFFFLLAVIGASGVVAGLFRENHSVPSIGRKCGGRGRCQRGNQARYGSVT